MSEASRRGQLLQQALEKSADAFARDAHHIRLSKLFPKLLKLFPTIEESLITEIGQVVRDSLLVCSLSQSK